MGHGYCSYWNNQRVVGLSSLSQKGGNFGLKISKTNPVVHVCVCVFFPMKTGMSFRVTSVIIHTPPVGKPTKPANRGLSRTKTWICRKQIQNGAQVQHLFLRHSLYMNKPIQENIERRQTKTCSILFTCQLGNFVQPFTSMTLLLWIEITIISYIG